MDSFEVSGLGSDTALHFIPNGGDELVMRVHNGPGDQSVTLRPEWLRHLAAWFAGEAEPVAAGDDRLFTDARRLAVHGDEMVLVYSPDSEAWLRCSQPYGTARVVVGPRAHMISSSVVVLLSPGARQDIAVYLRRVHVAA